VRTTPEFTPDTVLPALLESHEIASGAWGRLRVLVGQVKFVSEDDGESRDLAEGDVQIVPPGLVHHVELAGHSRFCIEFHRAGSQTG